MNWLLPAQTLLSLISAQAGAAQRWAESVDLRSLRTSVIAVAEARAGIAAVADPGLRARLDASLAVLLGHIQADSGIAPLDFTAEHANLWVLLYNEPTIAGVTMTQRQVYATALYEGLTVVEEAHLATGALQALGLRIQVI